MTKTEQEYEGNQKKIDDLDDRVNAKEREYLSKRLTFEVYEDQLQKMLEAANEADDGFDNHLSIERFQQEIKQFSKELPKLKSQMDTLNARIDFFKQKKQELMDMRAECKKLDYEVQLALEEKILKENDFNRTVQCRETLREIYKCRSTNDLPQKIFYSLPLRSKHSGFDDHGEFHLTFGMPVIARLPSADDLSKAIRLISKHIGRDWSRLYWQLPFYPSRGQEEVSRDINHIDDKYHRGDVFHVNCTCSSGTRKSSRLVLSLSLSLGSSERLSEQMASFSHASEN